MQCNLVMWHWGTNFDTLRLNTIPGGPQKTKLLVHSGLETDHIDTM
jgi:hypothetical protein